MNDSKQVTIVADRETLELIEELKLDFKAPTTAAVIRKALGIAKIARDQSRSTDGLVTLNGKGMPPADGITLATKS